MLELLIIGAGPHALTLICRLLEQEPDSSIDESYREARSRPALLRHWQQTQGGAGGKARRTLLTGWLQQHVAVVDPHGRWNARWDEQFHGLHIPHLRSPISVHPDPSSSWSLELWADMRSRNHEVYDMSDMGRGFDFRGPFQLPGTSLFSDFCTSVVERYGLTNIVHRGKAVSVEQVDSTAPAPQERHYTVTMADGSQLCARRVVIAIGSTNIPRVPAWAQHLMPKPETLKQLPRPSSTAAAESGHLQPGLRPRNLPRGAVLHAWDVARVFCPVARRTGMDYTESGTDALHRALSASIPLKQPARDASSYSYASIVDHASSTDVNIPPNPTAADDLSTQPSSPTDDFLGPGSSSSSSSNLERLEPLPDASTTSSRRPVTAADVPAPLCLDPSCTPLAGTRVVIVGGGLTSAQLALLAARHGCTDIVMLLRGPLRIQQFDIGVRWLGRNRGGLLTDLQVAAGDCAKARLAALRKAGAGQGSITPEALRMLMPHIRAHAVHIIVHEEVVAADWDGAYCWSCGTSGTQLHGTARSSELSPMANGMGFGRVGGSFASCSDVHSWGAWGLQLCGCGRIMQPDEVAEALKQAAETQGAGQSITGSKAGEASQHEGGCHKHAALQLEAGRARGTRKQRKCRSSKVPGMSESSGNEHGTCASSRGSSGANTASTGCCAAHSAESTSGSHVFASRTAMPDAGQCQWQLTDGDGVLWAHHLWLATGSVVDCSTEPLMRSLTESLGPPSDVLAGLPLLTDELRWHESSDVYVMGAYAALRLGPGALNLMGARTGARLIVDVLRDEAGLKPAGLPNLLLTRRTRNTHKAAAGAGDSTCDVCRAEVATANWLQELCAINKQGCSVSGSRGSSYPGRGRAQKAGGFKR